MAYENCVTRDHIEVWNDRTLPDLPVPVGLVSILRGSLLPIVLWLGVAVFTFFLYGPVVPIIEGFLFLFFFLLGFNLRRREHTVKCSLYGALGGC